MEYEGELKGAETVGRELIKAAVANVADGYLSHLETRQVTEWFDLGGSLQLSDTMSTKEVLAHAREVQGLIELAQTAGIPPDASPALLASGIDLEDLVSKLSDLLLSSGFSNPWGDPSSGDEDRTMQALHDAILEALFSGGVLSEEALQQLLGEPADGDQEQARQQLEDLIQQIIDKMMEQG